MLDVFMSTVIKLNSHWMNILSKSSDVRNLPFMEA